MAHFGCFSSKIPEAIQRAAVMKLKVLNAASPLKTLRVPPSNHLEDLRGDRKGRYSIRINQHWRICFVWEGSDAYEVQNVDCH